VWRADRGATETGRVVLSPTLNRLRLSTVANAAAGFDGAPVARALAEGDSLTAGFTVIDTPGHSPGHVSFWRETDRTLVCGDVFFNMSLLTTIAACTSLPLFSPPIPQKTWIPSVGWRRSTRVPSASVMGRS
jgi:glyoxylase-like metal-dependent hydrolase (beta-lactamase superfamily II)